MPIVREERGPYATVCDVDKVEPTDKLNDVETVQATVFKRTISVVLVHQLLNGIR